MLTKIISGGRAGAEQAALDVAITFEIPRGGWILKGGKTEGGIQPDKAQAKEVSAAGDPGHVMHIRFNVACPSASGIPDSSPPLLKPLRRISSP